MVLGVQVLLLISLDSPNTALINNIQLNDERFRFMQSYREEDIRNLSMSYVLEYSSFFHFRNMNPSFMFTQ